MGSVVSLSTAANSQGPKKAPLVCCVSAEGAELQMVTTAGSAALALPAAVMIPGGRALDTIFHRPARCCQ